jgi:hypothetical protein
VFSTLRTAPAGSVVAVVFAPANFDLIADASGPASLCVNGLRWLHIRYKDGAANTKTGWALESQNFFDGTYGPGTWLAPGAAPAPPPPPAAVACTATNTPNSLPTQFATVAATTAGKITARFSTLRPAPAAATGTIISNPATGTGPTFKVLGTRALGGFCWVNIQYTAGATGTGWALESQRFPGIYGAGYWLTKTAN